MSPIFCNFTLKIIENIPEQAHVMGPSGIFVKLQINYSLVKQLVGYFINITNCGKL